MFCSRSACRSSAALRFAKAPRTLVHQPRAPVAANALGMFTKAPEEGIYGVTVKDINGKDLKMSKFAGKVVLIVNVASACGFTPQYTGLAALDEKLSSKGLVVLGAPCNQFGAQEPGSEADIKKFAQKQGAKFPMTAKLDVNGPDASPLYEFLKSEKGGLLTSDVKWNFSKFLVDREGKVVERYFSTTTPEEIEKDIMKYL